MSEPSLDAPTRHGNPGNRRRTGDLGYDLHARVSVIEEQVYQLTSKLSRIEGSVYLVLIGLVGNLLLGHH